jgi:hypothetical protein
MIQPNARQPEAPPPRKRTASLSIVIDEPDAVESLNQELAVLDRPLEGEVEYYDERPPRGWRAGATGLVLTLVCGGGLLLALGRARVEADLIELVASAQGALEAPARGAGPARAGETPPPASVAAVPLPTSTAPQAGGATEKPAAARDLPPAAQIAVADPVSPNTIAAAPEHTRRADRARAHHSRSRSGSRHDRGVQAGHGKRSRAARSR